MKSHRYGVWGLALGVMLLGVAACDDETEVVIPPPPPPPLVVTVTPASQSVEVGETVQFVAQVTGGEEGTDRSVTWSSSNTNVATVDGNGLATAVAEGNTTIVATSTADATVQGAATLTVTDEAGAPVTISIQSVTTNIGGTTAPVDRENVFGQIDVTVNLEAPPGAAIDRVEVLVDGTVLYSQSFTTGSADVAEAAAAAAERAQGQVEIVASINTAAYNAETGAVAPLNKNGTHTLEARVVRPNGNVQATEGISLLYNNENFIVATPSGSNEPQTSSPSPRSLAPAGSLWHSGDISFNLLSVNYGGADEDVSQLTVTLESDGDGVSGVDGCVPDPDEDDVFDATADPTIAGVDGGAGAAEFPGCGDEVVERTAEATPETPTVITFPMTDDDGPVTMDDGGMAGVEDVFFEPFVSGVTSGGEAGPTCVNPDPVENPHNLGCDPFDGWTDPLRVDNLAPRVSQLSLQRPPNQYFGPNVFELDHEAGGTVAADGPCDDLDEDGNVDNAPCARTIDYGVGGTVASFQAGPVTEEEEVTAGGSELDESGTSDDYVLALTATDKSGNARQLWATDPAVNASGDISTTTADPEDDAATQFFGWDATNPDFERADDPTDMEANPDEGVDGIVFAFTDSSDPPAGPSGFLDDPVQVQAEWIVPGGTTCADVESGYADDDCAVADFYPSDGEFDTPGAAGVEGYFRYTAFVADAAGNLSEELTFWVLHDVTAPDVGGIASPSTITGGESETFTADIEDNVDLGSIQPYVGFGGATYINFPHTGGPNGYTLLNDYSPESLIDSDDGSITFEAFVRSLEDASDNLDPGVPDDGYVDADEILYLVRDMAGHQLRYVQSPWKGAPDDGVCAGQNCTLQFEDITANVEAADDPAFTALATLNADGGNPGTADVPGTFGFDWGNWRVLPYDVGVDDIVCNSTNTEDECPTEASNEIDLEAVLQGPAGSFQSPFAGVWFLFLNNEGNLDFIATASVTVTDNTIEDTRTVRYRGTWNAADLKVRPAGDPGTVYTVYALGITEDGDALLSVGQDITVEGDPE